MKSPVKVKKEVVYVDADDNPADMRRRRQVVQDKDAGRRVAVSKVANFVWLMFGILDMLLVFRFVLKLIGANPENRFADFIYDLSALFLKPFVGLVDSPTSDGLVFDVPVLIAIIVYSLVAWVLVRLVWLLLYHPGERVVSTYEESM